jgi:hypothetical protein
MRKESESSLRKALLLLTTTVAALGPFLGLPMKKAAAASADWKPVMGPAVNQQQAPLQIDGPRFVNPTAVTLVRIADQALSDNALAERIFRDPDGVAAQFHLSNSERLVLRHMDRTQFQVARADAAQVVGARLATRRPLPPGATDVRTITERMIVGRAILAAVGRSYLEAANAHGCCPWGHAIEIGVGGDPAAYNVAFTAPVAVPQAGGFRAQ